MLKAAYLVFSPRSAMLTLYGDYVRHRGGEIGIGSLIKLLSNFGLSDQAIRSAVSRMCRQGLLKVRRNGSKSYYSLTKEGLELMQKGEQRIFERGQNKWDGFWSTVVYFIPEGKREARDQFRQELSWIGYGPLTTATWVSPRSRTSEVEEIVKKLGIKDYVRIFQSKQLDGSDEQSILHRCWDLKRIHKKYAGFIEEHRSRLDDHVRRLKDGEPVEPSECFVERFKLIDEYRRLPYFDPDLPEELLPADWLRARARQLFDEYHGLLTGKANEYFDSVLESY